MLYIKLHRVVPPSVNDVRHATGSLEPLQVGLVSDVSLWLKEFTLLQNVLFVGFLHKRLRESDGQVGLLVVPLSDLLVEELLHAF